MENLFLSRLANVPEAVRGGNTGDEEGGRAQLWGQIAALELCQHRQRPGRPCVLVVSLFSLSVCMHVHTLTPAMSLWSSTEQWLYNGFKFDLPHCKQHSAVWFCKV